VFSIFASRTCQMSGIAVKVTLETVLAFNFGIRDYNLLTMCLADIGQALDGLTA
jgi:hypothetical protein